MGERSPGKNPGGCLSGEHVPHVPGAGLAALASPLVGWTAVPKKPRPKAQIDLPELPTWVPVAVDTETSGLHPDDGARVSVVSIGWIDPETDEANCRAFPFDQGRRDKQAQGVLDLWGDPNLGRTEWVALLAWLAQRPLIFHNAPFDLRMLEAGTRHFTGRDLRSQLMWGTSICQKELDPLELTGLGPSAE